MERITSRTNTLCTHVRKLNTSASYRRAQGQFVGEGPKLLAEALKWGGQVTTLLQAPGIQVDCPEGVRRVEMPEDLLRALSDTQTPQGVIFLCNLPENLLGEGLEGNQYLILDGVQDPGNLGTIWRTADGLGLDGLMLLEGCADPFAPKVVRATMGACFRTPIYRANWSTLAPKLDEADLPLYATALRDDTIDLQDQDLRRGAVVIGSEGRGVSQETLDRCQGTLKIPMEATCESLNAAVAATVVLWEMRRSRRATH